MATQTPIVVRDRRTPAASILAILVLGLILGAAALVAFIRHATTGILDRAATELTGRRLSFDNSLPTVLDKIQRLQRLETVTYSMDKIVEGDRQGLILPEFLVGDRLLLFAHGQVIAGIDLAQLKASDLQINGKSIKVKLPEPQIFVTTLDDTRTRVYSRTTGLLVPTDPNLETQVRQQAVEQFKQTALAGGVIQAAQTNARATIASLLSGLGFEKVEVD